MVSVGACLTIMGVGSCRGGGCGRDEGREAPSGAFFGFSRSLGVGGI